MKNLSKVILSALMFIVSSLAVGMGLNILSERQEFLLKPFLEQFEKDTGIKANVVYLKKGGLEKIQAQPGAIDHPDRFLARDQHCHSAQSWHPEG